jgi:ABC-type ATPase with predicted acetyltransferase domain
MTALPMPVMTPRMHETARCFGLRLPMKELPTPFPPGASGIPGQLAACLAAGEIALVCGPSGGGKSALLRALRPRLERPAISTDAVLPATACVDCFPQLRLTRALALLGRFGLGEVWTYLRQTADLSEGEQFRLRLAMAFARARAGGGVLLVDEYASCLDRITARVISRNLRQAITARSRVSAVVVTAHDDLREALAPDWVITCDFGHWSLYRCRPNGRRGRRRVSPLTLREDAV